MWDICVDGTPTEILITQSGMEYVKSVYDKCSIITKSHHCVFFNTPNQGGFLIQRHETQDMEYVVKKVLFWLFRLFIKNGLL